MRPPLDSPQLVEAPPFPPGAISREIAAALLEGRVDWHPSAFHNLVWHLLLEDKLCPAYHLLNYIELNYPDYRPQLPGWLVRAIALAGSLQNPIGQIAGQLMTAYGKFNEGCFVGSLSQWNHVMRFLLAAASLRPALLAPNTDAALILGHFDPKRA